MSSENIAFYARLKKIQELQHRRENKRLDLQRRFDNYAMSDQNLSRLRAARLQSYWKKVCEDERKSKDRNEQLLRDFGRVEAHIATLSSRTERLRLLKDQYERQVESMFPYWKEQMDIKRISQDQPNINAPMMYATPSQHYTEQTNTPNMPHSIPQNGMSMTSASTSYQQPPSISHGRPQPNSQVFTHPQQYSQHGAPKPDSTPYRMTTPSTLPHSEAQYPAQGFGDGYEMPLVPGLHGAPPHGQHAPVPGSHPSSYPSGQFPLTESRNTVPPGAGQATTYGQTEDSSSFTVSSESLRSPQHQVRQGNVTKTIQPLQAGQVKEETEINRTTLPGMEPQSESMQLVGEMSTNKGQRAMSNAISKSTKPAKNQIFTVEVVNGSTSGERLSSAQTEPFSSSDDSGDESKEQVDKALYSPEVPPELPKYEERARGLSSTGREQHHMPDQDMRGIPRAPSVMDDAVERSGSEEDSEIDSDVSLPLSQDRDIEDGPVQAERNSNNSKAPEAETVKPNPIVLSNEGFYLLMKAVEAEIDATDSLEGIYATLACTKTIRDEIVRTANSNSGFDLLDPRAISMVILEELPLLVRKLPGGCLLSERLLVASSRTITELSIRSHMMSSSLKLWDDIHGHMVFLVRRGVMEPEGVAIKFAPLLLAADSQANEKAVHVISDILMKAEEEEEEEEVTFGEESSFSDSSHLTPAQPSADAIQHAQPKDYPSVPPLALGGMEGDTDDLVDTGRTSGDSFFDNKVPLNETSAYQRMMMGSQPEMKQTDEDDGSGNDDDESDSEDEIERATRINVESPSSQQPKKKRNVLSSLGGSLGRSLGSDEEAERRPLPSDRTDEVSSPDKSEVASSLSPTPRGGGGGYVPSAMEQSLKSTGRTDTMNRSAAFWGNESDLDEESDMSVPMGTGKVEEEKDDFDFYD